MWRKLRLQDGKGKSVRNAFFKPVAIAVTRTIEELRFGSCGGSRGSAGGDPPPE
jgi:hypothetical protein